MRKSIITIGGAQYLLPKTLPAQDFLVLRRIFESAVPIDETEAGRVACCGFGNGVAFGVEDVDSTEMGFSGASEGLLSQIAEIERFREEAEREAEARKVAREEKEKRIAELELEIAELELKIQESDGRIIELERSDGSTTFALITEEQFDALTLLTAEISEISENGYAATWMSGCEAAIWRICFAKAPREYGQAPISKETVANLCRLARKARHWPTSEANVTLEEARRRWGA